MQLFSFLITNYSRKFSWIDLRTLCIYITRGTYLNYNSAINYSRGLVDVSKFMHSFRLCYRLRWRIQRLIPSEINILFLILYNLCFEESTKCYVITEDKAIGAAGCKKAWLLHSMWYRMIKRLANLPVQYMTSRLCVVTILKAPLNNLPKNMPEAALGRYL
jgi:hypothetical protein